jgi:hypothetical protein
MFSASALGIACVGRAGYSTNNHKLVYDASQVVGEIVTLGIM